MDIFFALDTVSDLLANTGWYWCVTGGVAAETRGAAYTPCDFDIMIDAPFSEESSFKAYLTTAGFTVSTNTLSETRPVIGATHTNGTHIDMIFVVTEYDRNVVGRSTDAYRGTRSMTTAQLEDLIVMKTVMNRPKDVAAVNAIIASSNNLNWNYINQWLGTIGTENGVPYPSPQPVEPVDPEEPDTPPNP